MAIIFRFSYIKNHQTPIILHSTNVHKIVSILNPYCSSTLFFFYFFSFSSLFVLLFIVRRDEMIDGNEKKETTTRCGAKIDERKENFSQCITTTERNKERKKTYFMDTNWYIVFNLAYRHLWLLAPISAFFFNLCVFLLLWILKSLQCVKCTALCKCAKFYYFFYMFAIFSNVINVPFFTH